MNKQWSLNKTDLKKSLRWSLVFLAPLGVIYFGSVIAVLNQPYHNFDLSDLVPSRVVQGACMLYIFDRLYDLCMRFISGD